MVQWLSVWLVTHWLLKTQVFVFEMHFISCILAVRSDLNDMSLVSINILRFKSTGNKMILIFHDFMWEQGENRQKLFSYNCPDSFLSGGCGEESGSNSEWQVFPDGECLGLCLVFFKLVQKKRYKLFFVLDDREIFSCPVILCYKCIT